MCSQAPLKALERISFFPVWENFDLHLKIYVMVIVCGMNLLVWQTCSLKHHWAATQEVTHLYCVPQWNQKGLDLLKWRIYSLEWEVITFTIISPSCVSYIKTFPPSPVIYLQMCSIFYVSNNEIISALTVDEIRLWLLQRRPHSGYMKSKTLLFNNL